MIIDTTNTFNSPVRTISGKVELFTGSTAARSGEVINLANVNLKNRKAQVNKEAICLGKNLMDYYHDSWLYDVGQMTFDNEIVNLSTTYYFFSIRYPTETNPWIKNNTTYTFSEDVLSYSDSNNVAVTITLVAIYNDDSYTEKNVTLNRTGRITATITTDATKPIKYLEVRPIRKGNTTSTLTAKVANLQLTIGDNAVYEVYKKPVASVNGEITLHAPNATVFAADGSAVNVTYTTDGLADTFTSNTAIKNITINRAGEMSKFFGFGISQETTIELIDKERAINVNSFTDYFKIHFKANGDYINNFPSFYVSDVNRDENTNELTITAQDALYGAATHIVDELGLESPYTIRDVAQACCGVLGLGLSIRVPEGDTAFDLNYPTGANFGGEETLRATLNAIAEATQTIYYLDNTDILVFKRLDKSGDADLLIDKSNYFTLNSQEQKRLASIVNATELGDNVETVPIGEGVSQYVWNNPFWDMRDDIATLIEDALTRVGGMTINQFECSWRGNFLLEIGDKINLITKDDNIITSYLLNDTIEYEGGFAQESSWTYEDTGESYTNPTSLGDVLAQTYAKVNKVDREIDIVASKADANSANLAQLRLTTDNISANVENVRTSTSTNLAQLRSTTEDLASHVNDVETSTNAILEAVDENVETLTQKVNAAITSEDVQILVSTELNKGIDKVTTATGFTFNEEGLTVSKSGSEMTTQITEDGMIVYRDNTAVLVANNEGVDATNLRATTYLIIGDNSRFEDYDNGTRTGCFWIG